MRVDDQGPEGSRELFFRCPSRFSNVGSWLAKGPLISFARRDHLGMSQPVAASASLSFRILGRFEAHCAGEPILGLEGRKLQEFLSYLLVFRNRPHHREFVAELIWGDSNQSRKYLRQAIWQLQRIFHRLLFGDGLLAVCPEWIQFNQARGAQLDVADLDAAFARVIGKRGNELAEADACGLEKASDLYKGELLEGFYQDWCVFERQRVRTLYLAILEKLLDYYETDQRLDEGLQCGLRLLHEEPAHERTHCRLMRLYYLAGDRTLALRQFQTCAAILRDDLGVKPAERTMVLHERIRADRGPTSGLSFVPQEANSTDTVPPSGEESSDLKKVAADLKEAGRLLSTALDAIAAGGRTVLKPIADMACTEEAVLHDA